MNKLIVVLATFFTISASCARAQAVIPPALPPGPLIATSMPEFSQWAIDYVYSDAPKPGEPSTLDRLNQQAKGDPSLAAALKDPQYVFSVENIRPVHTLITKTGEITHQNTDYEKGYKGDVWITKEFKVERRPNLPQVSATINSDGTVPAFPGFDWLSKDNFTGIETQEGRKCLVFQSQVDPIAVSHPGITGSGAKVSATAYIDFETRIPVSLQFGVESRKYTIMPAPTVRLDVPAEFADAAKAMMAQIQRATPHLSAP